MSSVGKGFNLSNRPTLTPPDSSDRPNAHPRKIISTGCCLANSASCEVRASNVSCLRCSGSTRARDSAHHSERQHLREACGIIRRGRGLCEHRIDLSIFRLRVVVVPSPRGAFHLADDRIKGAITCAAGNKNSGKRVCGSWRGVPEARGEPGFPDTPLTREQHYLTFTSHCSRPTPQEQFEFFFPPDQGSQAGLVQALEVAFCRTRPQCRPCPHWPGNALNVPGPRSCNSKRLPRSLRVPSAIDDHVRCGDPLQTRREVRRLATIACS